MSLLWIVAACGGGTDQPAQPPPIGVNGEFPRLSSEEKGQSIPLHRTDGVVDLSRVSPAPTGTDDTFQVVLTELAGKEGKASPIRSYRGDLPFPVSEEDARFRPADMAVFVDGVEALYTRSPMAKPHRTTWRISNGKLSLSNKGEVGTVEVRYPGVQRALDRHDVRASELTPQDFVRYDLSISGTTRQGLMLPAGATASFELTVPTTHPKFQTLLALEETPIPSATSDGAVAVLQVVAEGVTTEVARTQIATARSDFAPWTVDLSAWAGAKVTLRLQTDSGPTPDWDWLFWASPTVSGTAPSPGKRVVVIAFDTTRPDHIGFYGYAGGATPELDAIAAQSVVFDKSWSQAPRTRPSFRSATTGRLPLDAVGATNLGQYFSQAGWATAGIVANVHLQPRFDFHLGYDVWTYTGEEVAEVQVDRAVEWLASQTDRDAMLFLHFMDPHLPYKAPGSYEQRFVPAPNPELATFERTDILARMKEDTLTEADHTEIVARHDGEMAYLSSQVGRLFAALDAAPGEAFTVVHSDHGEEFWEHAGFEHNHSLYEETVRTVLWFRPKGGLKPGYRVQAPVSLIDLVPTVLDLASFPVPLQLDGVSLRTLLNGKGTLAAARPLGLGHLQYGVQRWGVVSQGHKYVIYTLSGRQQLFNLEVDPTEVNDLSATTDLKPWVDALVRSHAGQGDSAWTPLDAGPGWRIRLTLAPNSAPITVALPAEAKRAGVLDPEAGKESPANQEWGEVPDATMADVGSVVLSADRRAITITPGTLGQGVVWVRFDATTPAEGVALTRGAIILTVAEGRKGNPRWEEGEEKIIVEPGTVVVPPAGEWARMQAQRSAGGVAESDRAELIRLGYLQEDPPEVHQ